MLDSPEINLGIERGRETYERGPKTRDNLRRLATYLEEGNHLGLDMFKWCCQQGDHDLTKSYNKNYLYSVQYKRGDNLVSFQSLKIRSN